MRRLLFIWAFFLGVGMAFVQGCGGGGGNGNGGSSAPSERPVRTTINWPARSKVIYAPGPARSVKFTLFSTKDNKEIGSAVFNRKTDPAEYTETVTSSNVIAFEENAFLAKVAFYTDPDAGGAIVGTAQQTVSLGSDGTLLGTNGQSASFTVNKRVASLEIPTGQTLAVGDSKNIQYLARAADFTTVALSDGSAFFTLVSGGSALSVEPNGYATGKATGQAVVTARVEDITSEQTAVSVNLGVTTVEIAAGQTVGVGQTKTLSVTAKKANGGTVDLIGVAVTLTTADASILTTGSAASVTGASIGKTTVTATIGGVKSAETEVAVTIGPEITTASGLKYQDRKITNGQAAANGKTASVKYRGTLTDGTEFDSGTFSFKIGGGQAIKGFDEGVSTMKVGGIRNLVIPPNLGYGDTGSGKIPPGATLFFDITLESLQ